MIFSVKLISARSVALFLLLTAAFVVSASAQARYKIISLPTPAGYDSAALGLNDNGSVVGYSFQGDNYQAFLYSQSSGSSTDVGSLGGQMNAACAINDSGQVAGYSQDGNGNLLAFIYTTEDGIKTLGSLDGGVSSEAFGLNNSGQAVGDSQNATDDHRPVLFDSGAVKDLNVSVAQNSDAFRTAYAINDAGQIVGRTDTDQGAIHAFLLASPGGDLKDIGTLGGNNSEALAINKSGEVVGDAETGNGAPHAFLYRKGSTRDLGVLTGFDTASYARSINSQGEIVGDSESADQKRAFIYSNGQMLELDKLVTNLGEAGFASLDVAYGINNRGLIVGYGTATDGRTIAFLAVPEGQPAPQRAQVQQPAPQVQQPEAQTEEGNGDDYSVFYSRLSSDGDWVEAGDYGYVFRPHADEGDWAPYRDGHWVWTDRGWFWYSNEHFGWATYHYGRWVRITGQGWCWIPGNEWAPAWVSWRQSNDYVGWAPLPPEAGLSVNAGIGGWADSYYGLGPAAYTFINFKSWGQPSYLRVIAPPAQNIQIIRQTTNITNIRIQNMTINNFGPKVETIGQYTHQNIVQTKVVFNQNRQAGYGATVQGTELQVVAPAEKLRPVSRVQPQVKGRLAKAEIDNGWKNVNPAEQSELRKKFAEQNPPPKEQLPKPVLKPTFERETKNANPPAAGGPQRQQPTSPQVVKRPEGGAGKGWNTVPPNLIGGGKPAGERFQKTLPARRAANAAATPKTEEQKVRGKGQPPATPINPGQPEPKETPSAAGALPTAKQQQEQPEKTGQTPAPGNEGGPGKRGPGGEGKNRGERGPKGATTPKLETTPQVEETPKPEGAPKGESQQKEQAAPKVENPMRPEASPKGEAIQKEQGAPKLESQPKREGERKEQGGQNVENQPKPERSPKGESRKKEEGAPTLTNTPKEERSQRGEPAKKEEAPPKVENKPKEERPAKVEEPKKEEGPAKTGNRENRGPAPQGQGVQPGEGQKQGEAQKPERQEKERGKGKEKGSPTP